MQICKCPRDQLFAAVICAAAVLLSGCSTSEPPSGNQTVLAPAGKAAEEKAPAVQPVVKTAPSDAPNIILITIDALRADHLGCYGYSRNITPQIDALAAQGVLFEHVISTSSWTAPAMASLFTGRYPRTHTVRHGIYSPEDTVVVFQEKLPETLTTLPERLQRKGYTTIGISTNPHLIRDAGFARGFDIFHEDHALRDAVAAGVELTLDTLPELLADAQKTTQLALNSVAEADPERPFFLWVHYMDPHSPYFPREPWFQQFTSTEPAAMKQLYNKGFKELVELQTADASGQFLNDVMAAYDSEVAYADKALGDLLAGLPQNRERALFVLSDHGEQFYEHGYFYHGFTLFNEEIHVPLVIVLPGGRPPQRVSQTVSLLDVTRTVLDYAGIKSDKGQQGQSLLPLVTGEGQVPDQQIAVSEFERFKRYEVSVVRGTDKIIWKQETNSALYFDLKTDPAEHAGVPVRLSPAGLDLQKALGVWRDWTPFHEGVQMKVDMSEAGEGGGMEAAIMEEMKALGYAGG